MKSINKEAVYLECPTEQDAADTDFVNCGNTDVNFKLKEVTVDATSTKDKLFVKNVDSFLNENKINGVMIDVDGNVNHGMIQNVRTKLDLENPIEVNQLTASDAEADDQFGRSVAISSDGLIAITGAWISADNTGKVYTYKRTTIYDAWTEVNQLTASDAEAGDLFGGSVAMSSDGLIAMVGANNEDTAADNAGKVYTYKRATIDDDWIEVNQLTASDAEAGDNFGRAVAISSDGLIAMVGAYAEDTVASNAGKVYTYKRNTIDDVWTEVNTFVNSDSLANDGFGVSISMSDDGLIIMIGAWSEDTAATNGGKVYTYKRTTIDGDWSEVNTLTASDAEDDDNFGISVAISSDGLVGIVGARFEDTAADNAGKVYTYKRNTIDDDWIELNQLTASDAEADDNFGIAVAIDDSGHTFIICSSTEDTAADNAGKVYTYRHDINLNADILDFDLTDKPTKAYLGSVPGFNVDIVPVENDLKAVKHIDSIDINTDTPTNGSKLITNSDIYSNEEIVVNNVIATVGEIVENGVDLETNIEVNTLTASDAESMDGFGLYVALSGDGLTALICAITEDTAANNAGKVYTYKRATIDDDWIEVNQLTASDAEAYDYFGSSAAMSSDGLVAVVGAYNEDTAAINAGKVYTYKRDTIDDDWTEVNQLTASDAEEGDNFGVSVAISPDGLIAMVGARFEDTIANNAGKVYTYKRATIDDDWIEVNTLTASDAEGHDRYGRDVSISSDGLIAMVGAYYKNTTDVDAGKVYTYKRATIDDDWIEVNTLTASDAEAYDHFGTSVSISGDGLISMVVAYAEDTAGHDTGKAYTYKRDTIDDDWIEVNTLTASDAEAGDHFGACVSMSNNGMCFIIGSDMKNDGAGKAYTYKHPLLKEVSLSNHNLTEKPYMSYRPYHAELSKIESSLTNFVGDIPKYDNLIAANDIVTLDTGNIVVDSVSVVENGVDLEHVTEVNQLTASDAEASDGFGGGVAISSDGLIAMVGAYREDTAADNAGKVYTYKRDTIDDEWIEVNTLTASDAEDNDRFGMAVAMSSDGLIAMVGAYAEDTAADNAGKVYTYKRDTIDDNWTEVNTLTASDAEDDDYFGISVAISSDGLIAMIGAHSEDTVANNAGKVYTYKRDTIDDEWIEVNTLTASDAEDNDRFGRAVAMTGDGLISMVGAYGEDTAASNAGKVYTYKRDTIDDDWIEVNQLIANDAEVGGLFGHAVAISSNGLICLITEPVANSGYGKAYTYKRATIDDDWTEASKLTPNDVKIDDHFGAAAAMSSDGLVFIISSRDSDVMGVDSGKVYTYKRDKLYKYDVTFPEQAKPSSRLLVSPKSVMSKGTLSYTDTNSSFTITFDGISKQGRFFQRGLVATSKYVEILEPLQTDVNKLS